MEDVLSVTRENGKVIDTDMAITIHFDEFHRTDYVRTGGDAYVRHNETVWQPMDQGQWDITFDGIMGDSLDFYEALRSIAWKDAIGSGEISERDQYCEATAVDIGGQQAWKFTFHNVPQSLFEYGVGGKLGIGTDAFSQEKLISGWRFQSADYSATVIGFDADTRLVGESVRIESGDGSGNSFSNTWETKWSNFNKPVTIRQP